MKKNISPASMQSHAHAQHIVMVCVTRQRTCARLIEAGENIAAERALPLHVVHAVKTGENFLGNELDGEALEYLFTAAQLVGGDLAVLRADDVEAALVDYAHAHNASVIVLGASPTGEGESFVMRMQRRLPHVRLEII